MLFHCRCRLYLFDIYPITYLYSVLTSSFPVFIEDTILSSVSSGKVVKWTWLLIARKALWFLMLAWPPLSSHLESATMSTLWRSSTSRNPWNGGLISVSGDAAWLNQYTYFGFMKSDTRGLFLVLREHASAEQKLWSFFLCLKRFKQYLNVKSFTVSQCLFSWSKRTGVVAFWVGTLHGLSKLGGINIASPSDFHSYYSSAFLIPFRRLSVQLYMWSTNNRIRWEDELTGRWITCVHPYGSISAVYNGLQDGTGSHQQPWMLQDPRSNHRSRIDVYQPCPKKYHQSYRQMHPRICIHTKGIHVEPTAGILERDIDMLQ